MKFKVCIDEMAKDIEHNLDLHRDIIRQIETAIDSKLKPLNKDKKDINFKLVKWPKPKEDEIWISDDNFKRLIKSEQDMKTVEQRLSDMYKKQGWVDVRLGYVDGILNVMLRKIV